MITSFSSVTYGVPLLNQQFNWKHTLDLYFILWSHTLVINMSHQYLKTLSDHFILHPWALAEQARIFSFSFLWNLHDSNFLSKLLLLLDMQIASNHGSAWYNKYLEHAHSSFLCLTIHERISSTGEVFESWCPRTGRRFYSTSLTGPWNCMYFWCQEFYTHLVMCNLPEVNSRT